MESHQQSFADESSGSPSNHSAVRINLAHANQQFSFDQSATDSEAHYHIPETRWTVEHSSSGPLEEMRESASEGDATDA